jgi:hypothetical protein
LATAGLIGRKLDLASSPLQNLDRGDSGAREERVDEAGDEQGDPHGTRMLAVKNVFEAV